MTHVFFEKKLHKNTHIYSGWDDSSLSYPEIEFCPVGIGHDDLNELGWEIFAHASHPHNIIYEMKA